jgi:putative DNA primase/helicase
MSTDTVSQKEKQVTIDEAANQGIEPNLKRFLNFVGVGVDEPIELIAFNPKVMRGAEFAVAYGLGVDAVVDLAVSADSGLGYLDSDGLYMLSGVIVSGLHARYEPNRWHRCVQRGKDKDIVTRRSVFIDLDPIRQPKDISATDAERAMARKTAGGVVKELTALLGGVGSIGIGSSGNGWQVHIAVSMDNNDGTMALVQRLNRIMSIKYQTPILDVDESVFNAARLCPLFGTMKRKGFDLKTGPVDQRRPHRRSFFWCAPGEPKRLDIGGFAGLIRQLEIGLTPEQKAELKKEPSKAKAKPSSVGAAEDRPLDRCNAVSVSDVARALGIDPEAPVCPGCGADKGIACLESKGMNILKCQHATCGAKAWGPVSLVAHHLGIADLKGDKEAFKGVVSWFAEHGFVEPLKALEPKKRTKKAPTDGELRQFAAGGIVVEDYESAADVGIIVETHNSDNVVTSESTPVAAQVIRRNLTDLGNAERFVDQHGDDIRYVTSWNKWICWDGRRWVQEDPMCLVHQTVRGIYAEAEAENDNTKKAEITGWARTSEGKARLDAVLGVAADFARVRISHKQLDADPMVINVQNGIVDLRTGKLRPHTRSAYCTKIAAVTFDPKADRSLFEAAFAKSLPDPLVRSYVLRLLGYSLTGVVDPHIMPVHYGKKGRSGKGTFLGSLVKLMGDYATETPTDLIMETQNQHPTGLTKLFGARLVVASESGKSKAMNVEVVKRLSGGDQVSARRMREDFWEFDPTHKIHLATNHKPRVQTDPDDPIWERLSLIEWTYIPIGERNIGLKTLLSSGPDGSGFFSAVVAGCLEWLRIGLNPPASVQLATESYADESDNIGDFVEEWLIIEEGSKVTASALYSKYRDWAESNGVKHTYAQRGLTNELTERGMGRSEKLTGVMYRVGVRIRVSADDPEQRAEQAAAEQAVKDGFSSVPAKRAPSEMFALTPEENARLGIKPN